jgi:hypothetical protein
VEVQKIEQEEDQRRCIAAVRSKLDNAEGGDTVGAHAAQFAVEIGLAHLEPRDGFGDRRIFVGPDPMGVDSGPRSGRVELLAYPLWR